MIRNFYSCIPKLFFFVVLFTNVPKVVTADIAWLETNSWSTFEGYMGADELQLSVYLFEDGKVSGNYIFRDSLHKISFSGYTRLNEIRVREDNVLRQMALEISDDSTYRLMGNWIDEIHDQSRPVRLKLTHVIKSSFEKRYPGLFGTTEEIEAFMLKIKQSIIANDRQWMADHLQFPVRGVGRDQFLRNMNGVIESGLKKKIRYVYTTNLFTRHGLVMMADGEIWVGNTPDSTVEKYDFIIVTI